uniref:Uncharacterized protein n=1 Tax=Rhizophora mucronata TaxID=61149 RepID=A0A2P2QTU5_RHIMU
MLARLLLLLEKVGVGNQQRLHSCRDFTIQIQVLSHLMELKFKGSS